MSAIDNHKEASVPLAFKVTLSLSRVNRSYLVKFVPGALTEASELLDGETRARRRFSCSAINSLKMTRLPFVVASLSASLAGSGTKRAKKTCRFMSQFLILVRHKTSAV